eukprot:g17096.t1
MSVLAWHNMEKQTKAHLLGVATFGVNHGAIDILPGRVFTQQTPRYFSPKDEKVQAGPGHFPNEQDMQPGETYDTPPYRGGPCHQMGCNGILRFIGQVVDGKFLTCSQCQTYH